MVEYVLIVLNIELEIMFELLVNNFARVHFLHTMRQTGIATKHTNFIVSNSIICINSLKY